MADEIILRPEYKATMERLQELMRHTATGKEYWRAREIHTVLGYAWEGFGDVIKRAMEACGKVGVGPEKHFRQTSTMVEIGSGAKREVADYFLSRIACYLIAMNGEPSKAEVAAAQAYFAIQTRRMELQDQRPDDEKRLELREKVSQSHRKVSAVAKAAGVRDRMQPIFHDARSRGLYGMSNREVKRKKGLTEKDNLFDYAGALELSANDFQMRLAADVLEREHIQGEQTAITVNKDVGNRVREAIRDSKGTMPEDLKLEEPIKNVKKRLKQRAKKQIAGPGSTESTT